MNELTLERLREDMQAPPAAQLPPHRLARLKRRAVQRRRTRMALVAGAATAVLAGSVALVAPLTGDSPTERLQDVATRPDRLSELQERVLREVPGARRLSTWQVAVPEPEGAVQSFGGPGAIEVEGETFPTGVPSYAGVTLYERDAFPGWLYDAVLAIEEEAGDENGQPVGSTDMGIAVRNGMLELACVSFPGAGCEPAVIRTEDGQVHYEWGFGSDRFLRPMTGMEVFAGDAAAEDAPSLAVAGLPDDSVTEVEFINTAGDVVDGRVDHTMAPGSSILWAAVPGALARVVAYDADGAVVDDHQLRPCTGGVDCEVR